MGLLKSVLRSFYVLVFERKWKYLNSNVRIQKGAKFSAASNANITNTSVFVDAGGSLTLEEGACIQNCDVYVHGTMRIGKNTKIGTPKKRTTITIDDGQLNIGHHSQVLSDWVWIRFGGQMQIGDYTNINGGGQLRADESVQIGDYCMISYNVNIWDTNTHTFYPVEKRRELTEKYWPYYGREIEKPKTAPVSVGNDVWIGENVSILKGSSVDDGSIIGYGCTIAGKQIEAGVKVVPESNIRIIK